MKRAMTEYDFTRQISCWQPGAQPYGWCQNLGAKLLAVGIASALAIFAPLKAEATIQKVTQEVSLMNQPLDMNVDGIPDLLCMAGEDTDTDNWTNTNYLYCRAFGGARIWGNTEGCLPITAKVSQIATPSEGGSWQAVCQLGVLVDDGNAQPETGSSAGPSTKTLTLGIMTSAKEYSTLNVVVNSTNTEVKTVSWTYDGPPPDLDEENGTETPVVTLSPPVVNSDNQVTLTWANHNSNETGFKIYRDEKLIATLPANATSYVDTSLPCAANSPYIYEIRATNSQGDFEPVAVTVTIGNICSSRGAMLFTAADGPGSGKVTTLPNTVSCEVSDCHDDPKDSKHQICDKDKCNVQLEKLTVVKLIPQADSGSYFSSWGGHEDCVDGEVVMTENKLCVAYFHSNGAKRKITPPLPTLPIILPPLGTGQAVCHHGEEEETSALFSGGVSVNGSGSYQQTATVKAFVDQIDIQGKIKVDSQHLSSLTSDIFVYLSYQATVQDAPTFWMVDEQKKFWPWDEKPVSLVPFQTRVSLTANDELTVKIYQGTVQDTGIVKIFFGYRLGNGTVVCNFAGPLELKVE